MRKERLIQCRPRLSRRRGDAAEKGIVCRQDGFQKGAVLLLVLWLIVAVSLLGLSFSGAIRTEVTAARNVVDQKQGYYLARAGIEYAVYKILESQSAFFQSQALQELGPEEVPEVLTGASTLQMENGSAEIEIIDETGKINLNALPLDENFSDLVYNLLIMVGSEPNKADEITDSILDWRDDDDFTSPNGAESDYYSSLQDPYVAKNGFFDVPDELLLVKGVTPEIYYGRKTTTEDGRRVELYGLQKYFTTFLFGGNTINVNSAPLPVLAALPYLDYDTALRIHELRQEGPIRDATELMERIPGLPTNVAATLAGRASGNNVYTLVSTGRLRNSEIVSQIRCVVQIDSRGPKGYSVLYWNEADTEI